MPWSASCVTSICAVRPSSVVAVQVNVSPAATVTSSGQTTVVVSTALCESDSAICCSTFAVSSRVRLATAESRNATATPAMPSRSTTSTTDRHGRRAPGAAAASCSSPKMLGYAGTGAEAADAPGSGCVESDHDTPFHQRRFGAPDGSGYHPGSGELCSVTARR